MKGFLLGLLVAALAFGGFLYWQAQKERTAGGPAGLRADAAAPVTKKKRRSRGAARLSQSRNAAEHAGRVQAVVPEPEPEPEPVRLSPSDLKIVGQGDDLSRPDVLRLDMSEGGDTRELSQEDIDERFRADEGAILDCISKARPDSETYVPGRVTVKFRIQRAGTVRGVRVEAPAVLQKGGLFGCVKGVVGRMKFPASGGSQVVTYPFTLS